MNARRRRAAHGAPAVAPASFARRSGVALAAVVLALPLLPGCSALRHLLFQPRIRECEGFDVPLSAFSGSSRKELRVRIVGRRLDQDIPFVVETGPQSFVIVAFTPLGTKAFTLVRRDDVLAEVESFVGPVLPVPPRNIMADVLAMSLPSSCLATPEGVAGSTVGTWEVSDACRDARPVQRRLAKPGKEPEVVVDYTGDAIVVSQKTCRYTARYVFQGAAPAPVADDVGEEPPPASGTTTPPPGAATPPPGVAVSPVSGAAAASTPPR